MFLSLDVAVNDPVSELLPDGLGSIRAHADQSHSPIRETLDRGDTDLLGQASRHDLPFVHLEVEHPGQLRVPRFAAATASRALV